MATLEMPHVAQPAMAAQYNRVPKVTLDFWLVKLLAVTVGETAADYLNQSLGLGLSATAWIMTGLLIAALMLQFAQRRYRPSIYWLAVVLVSVVGTLITDTLVDVYEIPLETTTIGFAAALGATFALWHASERTLSIHTITTARREAFYWLAILFTFALGTASGDLLAESMSLGYLAAGGLFCVVIAAVALGYFILGMNGLAAFWLAYIFTRPLGAAFGDLLSQAPADGGLGFGAVLTSALFLGAIAAVVAWMSLTHSGEERARA